MLLQLRQMDFLDSRIKVFLGGIVRLTNIAEHVMKIRTVFNSELTHYDHFFNLGQNTSDWL